MLATPVKPTSAVSNDDQLKALRAFLQLTKNPAEFNAIYDLDEVLRKSAISEIGITYLKTQPGIAEIMQERYLAPVPDLDELLTYPPDSLGYCFAAHLRAQNFEPKFYRDRDIVDDITYLSLRRSQTHDIHHIITGCGTDLAGEVALQAFQLAQIRSPLAIALLSSAIVYTLSSPTELNSLMAALHQGWQMGIEAKPFFAQKWEEDWQKPVAAWRAELGVPSLK